MTTNNVLLFVDGSVNPQTQVGYAACLVLEKEALTHANPLTVNRLFTRHIKTQHFAKTSSTKLELQALLWALTLIPKTATITVYTDCQNIMRLPQKKQQLVAKNFCNKKGEKLNLANLYQLFYEQHQVLNFDLVKLKGHKPSQQKSILDSIFTLVDHTARLACRQYNNTL